MTKLGRQELCPLQNMKKLSSDETSHLPMRLALNGEADDRLAAEQYLRELKILSTIRNNY